MLEQCPIVAERLHTFNAGLAGQTVLLSGRGQATKKPMHRTTIIEAVVLLWHTNVSNAVKGNRRHLGGLPWEY
jgi:hypothetical protein